MSNDEITNMLTDVNNEVTGYSMVAGGKSEGADPPKISAKAPAMQAVGVSVQSIAQSMAIAVQDATDLLRNISTIETTAIGVASAKWVANPENVLYKQVISSCEDTIKEAADIFKTIGINTSEVLKKYIELSDNGS